VNGLGLSELKVQGHDLNPLGEEFPVTSIRTRRWSHAQVSKR
jgi:hypothetical protein